MSFRILPYPSRLISRREIISSGKLIFSINVIINLNRRLYIFRLSHEHCGGRIWRNMERSTTRNLQNAYFPYLTKIMLLYSQYMSETAFFAVMLGIINEARKETFLVPFPTSNRQRISSDFFS